MESNLMGNSECGIRNAEFGMRNSECGIIVFAALMDLISNKNEAHNKIVCLSLSKKSGCTLDFFNVMW